MDKETIIEVDDSIKHDIDKKELMEMMMRLYAIRHSNELKSIEDKISPEEEEIFNQIKMMVKNEDKDAFKKGVEDFKSLDSKEKAKRIGKSVGFFRRLRNAFSSDINIDPSRLLALIDGIFGMVMTLLAFGIALPEITMISTSDYLTFISELLPNIGVVIVSFVVVSTFWIYHHEFMKFKTLNLPFLWLNIFFLASISFIPFTTSLIGAYSHFFYSEVIFGLNIFVNIVLFLIMHDYAVRKDLLEHKVSRIEKRYTVNTFTILMILTMIVNLLDFFVSPNFIYLFLLMPIISTLRDIHIGSLITN